MDMYLAALAYTQMQENTARAPGASLSDEDAYYARATWSLPSWVLDAPAWTARVFALVRNGRRKTSKPTPPVARHA